MDADIAAALLPEIPNEFDQPAVEHRRIGPISVKGRRRRDMLRDPVDECREWLDLAARPELRPLGVATAAEKGTAWSRWPGRSACSRPSRTLPPRSELGDVRVLG